MKKIYVLTYDDNDGCDWHQFNVLGAWEDFEKADRYRISLVEKSNIFLRKTAQIKANNNYIITKFVDSNIEKIKWSPTSSRLDLIRKRTELISLLETGAKIDHPSLEPLFDFTNIKTLPEIDLSFRAPNPDIYDAQFLKIYETELRG